VAGISDFSLTAIICNFLSAALPSEIDLHSASRIFSRLHPSVDAISANCDSINCACFIVSSEVI